MTSSYHNPPFSVTRFPHSGAVEIGWFVEDFEPVVLVSVKVVSERPCHANAQITWASTRIRFQTWERRPLGGSKSKSTMLARPLERNAIIRIVSENVANLLPF